MPRKTKRKELPVWAIVVAVLLVVAILIVAYLFRDRIRAFIDGLRQDDPTPAVSGDISIWFLELGNKYTGDCTFIRVGDVDILIDAGSRTASIPTIREFLDAHMADDLLDYVIVTHAHEDHYAGFATPDGTDSLFDLYRVGTIIDFAMTNQKSDAKMYNNYLRERQEEIDAGAVHYTARECVEQGKTVFQLSDGVKMEILDQKFYYEKSSSENNYSVCTLFTQGDHHYLLTGDLESDGEASLLAKNDLPEVDLYKAGHHGSKTSSSAALMEKIRPEIVCVCCCAGSPEYTPADENQFPTQDFVDRVAPYTDRVYVTTLCVDYKEGKFSSMNGIICVQANGDTLTVTCSASDKILREWEWFREHRTCPAAWK